jgi:hypothetical protein
MCLFLYSSYLAVFRLRQKKYMSFEVNVNLSFQNVPVPVTRLQLTAGQTRIFVLTSAHASAKMCSPSKSVLTQVQSANSTGDLRYSLRLRLRYRMECCRLRYSLRFRQVQTHVQTGVFRLRYRLECSDSYTDWSVQTQVQTGVFKLRYRMDCSDSGADWSVQTQVKT